MKTTVFVLLSHNWQAVRGVFYKRNTKDANYTANWVTATLTNVDKNMPLVDPSVCAVKGVGLRRSLAGTAGSNPAGAWMCLL
jgi:hypothetical protein